MPSTDYALSHLCDLWLLKIAKAKQVRERLWGATARECMSFYNGPHDFMYGPKNARNGVGMYTAKDAEIKTTFKVTVNLVAELVQRFGPTLYFQNPTRQVNPRKPDISQATLSVLQNPMLIQQAMMGLGQQTALDTATSELLSWYLNFTPNELGLRDHSRIAIVEALIMGMGCLWTEVYQPAGSNEKLVGSFYDSAWRYIIDPDASTEEEAKWVVRECIHPKWEVEAEYGYPPGSLKGNFESANQQSMVEGSPEFNRDRLDGKTNDLLVYYKIYSRMGAGGRLKEARPDDAALEPFGDNVFLVVAKGIPFPLNFPPELANAPPETPGLLEAMQQALRWPLPFWADHKWPVSTLGFHPLPGCPYPMSHMKPALGELRFINWCMSFLADKVYLTSRELIAVAEHLEQDVTAKIKNSDGIQVIGLKNSMHRNMQELIQYVQHPPMNQDILTVVNMVMELFKRRTGLTDLMYGETQAQLRSAEEAAMKKAATNLVVDDMSECVQTWQTGAARREALACRWSLGPQDVAPHFGEIFNPQAMQVVPGPFGQPVQQPAPQIGPITQLWMQLVHRPPDENNPGAIYQTVREMEYRIEAGSLRKPDNERDLANMDQMMQSPFAQTMFARYQATGDPTQVNALMVQWCKTRQIDPQPFLFPALPPPMPVQPQQQPGPGQPRTIPMRQGA